jgi:sterol carrier protein 2
MTGIPIHNLNNACDTGSTGIELARNLVRGGTKHVVMVVGFETMKPGSIKTCGMTVLCRWVLGRK